MIFDKINPNVAEDVLKTWRRGSKYQDAIEQIATIRKSSGPEERD